MLQAQVFTLYPEVFPGPLDKGLYGKAMAKRLWSLNVINIRDAATDKHKTVDDTPYGGGTGMLLKPDVLAKSIDQNINKGERIFYLSPKGKKFDPNMHQAMTEIEDDKSEAGLIIQEIQPGYMLGERLLRPALVGVSKKKKSKSEEKDDKNEKK